MNAATRIFAHRIEAVNAASRAKWCVGYLFSGAKQVGIRRNRIVRFSILKCPNFFGALDVAQITTTDLDLGAFAGLHKVWDCNRREHPHDKNHEKGKITHHETCRRHTKSAQHTAGLLDSRVCHMAADHRRDSRQGAKAQGDAANAQDHACESEARLLRS